MSLCRSPGEPGSPGAATSCGTGSGRCRCRPAGWEHVADPARDHFGGRRRDPFAAGQARVAGRLHQGSRGVRPGRGRADRDLPVRHAAAAAHRRRMGVDVRAATPGRDAHADRRRGGRGLRGSRRDRRRWVGRAAGRRGRSTLRPRNGRRTVLPAATGVRGAAAGGPGLARAGRTGRGVRRADGDRPARGHAARLHPGGGRSARRQGNRRGGRRRSAGGGTRPADARGQCTGPGGGRSEVGAAGAGGREARRHPRPGPSRR